METFGRILASGCTSMLVYGVFEWVRGPEKMIKIAKNTTFGLKLVLCAKIIKGRMNSKQSIL